MASLLDMAFKLAVKTGRLQVVAADGTRHDYGDGTGPEIILRFHDRAAERAFVFNPDLMLGELYTDARITLEAGSLFDFLSLMLREQRDFTPPWPLNWLEAAEMFLWRTLPKNPPDRSRRNVSHHYDLGDALYALFLDEDWQYSCAYYETPDETLDQAQLSKKRHIAAKLRLAPGQKVLDIGCGWGGLALYLAQATEVGHVTGVTLSTEQIHRATQRAQAAGLTDRVRFALQDYRAVEGPFDRIVSVGMFEHVGLGSYDTFFAKCRALMQDRGVMLLHTIGLTGTPGPTNPWILKHIFPGGHLPALSDIVGSVERSGLIVTDVETLGPHYAETLRAWRCNFDRNRDKAQALFDARFCRMWDVYLTMAEVAFRTNDITLYQLQLARDRTLIPMTRDYIQQAEQALRQAEDAD
jgi:cyclopropane-fatty-acyl-phospholipid synthase